MWQRFTEHARHVILFGQEEAGKLDSGHVGTEHLLLGLLRENEGGGARVLQEIGFSFDQVREATLLAMPVANNPILGEPKLTPQAKRVLELAADEARRMRHNYIGSEHLLLAFLREKDGMASSVLRGLGMDLETARAQVANYLDKVPAPIAATAGASGDVSAVAAQFRVAPDVRELLDFAAQESRVDGAPQVEIVHLLRALCHPNREGARILREAGVDVEALRARL